MSCTDYNRLEKTLGVWYGVLGVSSILKVLGEMPQFQNPVTCNAPSAQTISESNGSSIRSTWKQLRNTARRGELRLGLLKAQPRQNVSNPSAPLVHRHEVDDVETHGYLKGIIKASIFLVNLPNHNFL